VISPDSQAADFGLSSTYTGQSLVWGQKVNWNLLSPGEWVRWLFYRDFPRQSGLASSQTIILWLRSDLFPGASSATANP
jgi:hypothetical protein